MVYSSAVVRTRANDLIKVQELMDSICVIGLQVPMGIYMCIFILFLPYFIIHEYSYCLVLVYLDGFSVRFKHTS
jgi:hypothetical protein